MSGSNGSAKWNGSWSRTTCSNSSEVETSVSRSHEAAIRSRSVGRLDRLHVGVEALEEAHRGHAAGDDRRRGHARIVDRLLQGHERAVGMPEHRVSLELHGAGQHDHVLRVSFERPRLFRRAEGTSAGALVHEHHAHAALGQRIEVVAELVMVEPRPAVQDQQRHAVVGPPLDDPERGVVDLDEPARVGHGAGAPQDSRPVMRKPPSRTL